MPQCSDYVAAAFVHDPPNTLNSNYLNHKQSTYGQWGFTAFSQRGEMLTYDVK